MELNIEFEKDVSKKKEVGNKEEGAEDKGLGNTRRDKGGLGQPVLLIPIGTQKLIRKIQHAAVMQIVTFPLVNTICSSYF